MFYFTLYTAHVQPFIFFAFQRQWRGVVAERRKLYVYKEESTRSSILSWGSNSPATFDLLMLYQSCAEEE